MPGRNDQRDKSGPIGAQQWFPGTRRRWNFLHVDSPKLLLERGKCVDLSARVALENERRVIGHTTVPLKTQCTGGSEHNLLAGYSRHERITRGLQSRPIALRFIIAAQSRQLRASERNR